MIKAIAFDLDDTLLNTTHILIPNAIKRIYELINKYGFADSFEAFNSKRLHFVAHSSHKEFFKKIVSSNPQLLKINGLSDVLIQYFYQPEIPPDLPLIEGAKENLEYLSIKYPLYIVTSGNLATQKQKIAALKIQKWIPEENHYIIDGTQHVYKKQAFEAIIAKEKITPPSLLSFGNRLSQEIRMAKELGCTTCYFKFGEHANDTPIDNYEVPDFSIQTQKELIPTCRL